jgi:hypothetical protein
VGKVKLGELTPLVGVGVNGITVLAKLDTGELTKCVPSNKGVSNDKQKLRRSKLDELDVFMIV